MNNQFGITAERIESILVEAGMRTGEVSSAEKTRAAIAKIVIENNTKILEDVKKLIAESGTAKFG